MFGVIADSSEKEVIQEFFELFKTPWEFYRDGGRYDVILCSGDTDVQRLSSKLVLVYSSRKTSYDSARNVEIRKQLNTPSVSSEIGGFPLYGACLTFAPGRIDVLTDTETGGTAGFVDGMTQTGPTVARIGYDLFQEIEFLLVQGQSADNAGIATLDLHIEFLRDLIAQRGIAIVEIPPVPEGYRFIACLTHDVDHASLRRHRFDHTALGFLYRATAGSASRYLGGELRVRQMLTNWLAAAKLPLVYAGIARDFWLEFDRYLQIENGHPSTFFVIPKAGYPGRTEQGNAPSKRATGYGAQHIAGKIQSLRTAGSEIALHGIDAWLDSSRAGDERAQLTSAAGAACAGVRMHWLYWNQQSPAKLEKAGFAYDSTSGFNDAVGYRAGTSQVFRLPGTSQLMELPLHIMDTALFTSGRMNLSLTEAWKRLAPILDNADRNGGVLTINWHDRSIAPERLWGDFYVRVIQDLEARNPWFATANQAVAWFRKRRAAVFEQTLDSNGFAEVKVRSSDDTLPGLQVRLNLASAPAPAGAAANTVAANTGMQKSIHMQISSQIGAR